MQRQCTIILKQCHTGPDFWSAAREMQTRWDESFTKYPPLMPKVGMSADIDFVNDFLDSSRDGMLNVHHKFNEDMPVSFKPQNQPLPTPPTILPYLDQHTCRQRHCNQFRLCRVTKEHILAMGKDRDAVLIQIIQDCMQHRIFCIIESAFAPQMIEITHWLKGHKLAKAHLSSPPHKTRKDSLNKCMPSVNSKMEPSYLQTIRPLRMTLNFWSMTQ